MANKMLIDAAHPEETRVVVTRGKRVEDFDFEAASRKPLRGNIYLAKVTRVEPSLQAAFVEYGGNRHGFLAFSEIHPDYYQIPHADRLALLQEEAAADAEADRAEADRATRGSSRRSRGRRGDRPSAGARRSRDDEKRQPSAASDRAGRDDAEAGAAGGEGVVAAAIDADSADSDEMERGDAGDAERSDASGTPAAAAAAAQSDADADADAAAGSGEEPRVGAVDAAEIDATSGEAPEGATGEAPVEVPAATTDADTAFAATATGDDADEAGHPATHAAADASEGEDEDENATESEDDSRRAAPAKRDGPLRERAASVVARSQFDDEDADTDDPDGDGDGDGDSDDEGVESVGAEDVLEEASERRRRPQRRTYKIQEVIRRRQVLLVQVVKEERGNKGAALTTYLSLAGRYSVLMPNTDRGGGISRKIADAADRKRLKAVVDELDVPQGMGVILRTAGASRTKSEVKRDFEYLLRLWENVRELTLKSIAPKLVYEEGSLIKRSIRDLYGKDIDEILVSGDHGYREAKEFMRMLMPSHAKNVQQYRSETPIFIAHGVEQQLDAMFSPQVTLPSGGYIVINPTEALVSIDVNSGRATREHHIEDTALRTNLEAAEEIARQLRLRDLAGLIVIDFIDMEERKNNRSVEKTLKDCLKADRARIQLGRISHFGLLEMSRQRIRQGVVESSSEICPHCHGSGFVRSTESVALHCLRAIEDHLLRNRDHNLTVECASAIALYILNQKRPHVIDLEARFGLTIYIEANDGLGAKHLSIKDHSPAIRGEILAPERPATAAISTTSVDPADLEVDDEVAAPEAVADAEPETADAAPAGAAADADADAESEDDDGRSSGSRRRRRRRRGRSSDGEQRATTDAEAASGADGDFGDTGEEEPSDADAREAAEAADQSEEADAADPAETEEQAANRRRRGRRGGRRHRRERPAGEERAAAASGEDAAAATGAGADAAAAEAGAGPAEAGTPTETGEVSAGTETPTMAGDAALEAEAETPSEAGCGEAPTGAAAGAPRDAADVVAAPAPTARQAAADRTEPAEEAVAEPAAVDEPDEPGTGEADHRAAEGVDRRPAETAAPGSNGSEHRPQVGDDGEQGLADRDRSTAAEAADDDGGDADTSREEPEPATATQPAGDRPKRGGWWQRRSFF